MTEAGWTREKPTVAGWYWWRFDASTSATIVRIMVCGDGSLAEMSNNGHLLLAANFGGEWLGPITPDSYQQGREAALDENNTAFVLRSDHDAALRAAKVEGLREAAGRIRKRGDEYMKDCEAKDASGKKYRDTYEMRRVNSGRAWAFKDLADELDARAAQIEEG